MSPVNPTKQMANIFSGFGGQQPTMPSFGNSSTTNASLPAPAWPSSGFGVFNQQTTTPSLSFTQQPVPNTQPAQQQQTTATQQQQGQERGQIIQCLSESKNVQLAILNELKLMNDKLIKQTPPPSPPPMSPNTVHTGVFCNRCSRNNITGARYKCLFCKDFDMCEQCEQQVGSHDPSHFMIKIKDTNTFNAIMAQKPAFFSV